MFDFEKFPVYQKTKGYILDIQPLLNSHLINIRIKDQLYRASSSILLNIAEGAGKYSKKDKRRFYVIARGSVNECVAILRLLKLENTVNDHKFQSLYDNLLEIAKMLSGLIKKMGH